MKKVLLRMGSLLFGLLVASLMVEVYFRWIWQPLGAEALLFNAPAYGPRDLYIDDPELLMVPRPGFEGDVAAAEYRSHVRINALGLRGPPVPEKPAEGLRLLAVGDSFTMAAQVEEAATFQALLADSLSERLGRPVEVLNGGVDGYGTLQALGRAERLSEALGLDGVLYVFFMGNDLFDNVTYRPPLQGRHPGGPHLPTMQGAPPPLALPLWRRVLASWSYTYAFLEVTREARNPNEHAMARFRTELDLFVAGSPGLRHHLGETRRALAQVQEHCESASLQCFVATAPASFMVDPARAASTFEVVGLDPSRVDVTSATAAVLEAVPAGLPALDLTPALTDAARDGKVYFIYDGHWTPLGHQAAARALSDWMAPLLAD